MPAPLIAILLLIALLTVPGLALLWFVQYITELNLPIKRCGHGSFGPRSNDLCHVVNSKVVVMVDEANDALRFLRIVPNLCRVGGFGPGAQFGDGEPVIFVRMVSNPRR